MTLIFFRLYRTFLRENGESNSKSCFCSTLSDDQNLNGFKNILTLPPMWKELKKLGPFMILLWPTMPHSVNSGAVKIGWKLDMCGKESFIFCAQAVFPVSKNEKRVDMNYCWSLLAQPILLEAFSSILKMTQKIVLLSYKTSLVKVFYELRASILRLNSFIRRKLRCSSVGMRLDEDLCFNKKHRFWKRFLKQSNFG